MHGAPSVSYPVGRSAFAGRLLACLLLAGLAATLAWCIVAPVGWRQAAGFATLLACGVFSVLAWSRSPAGVLHWEGAGWTWEEGGRVAAGRPELALDLQRRLLLRWQPDAGRARWLWVERASDASHWDALRRAVYSRASTHVPAASQPPAAEQ
jgi:toxin CptA